MVGAAIKGLSKILKKSKVKRPRGTPTKAGLVARRKAIRGDKDTPKASDFISRRAELKGIKAPKKIPLIGKTEKGIGIGVASTLAYQELRKGQKEAKAKEDKKLKKALEKKKAEDEKKKKAYGKRAPKKDKNYGGR